MGGDAERACSVPERVRASILALLSRHRPPLHEPPWLNIACSLQVQKISMKTERALLGNGFAAVDSGVSIGPVGSIMRESGRT